VVAEDIELPPVDVRTSSIVWNKKLWIRS
jgi:hypothetical protein